MNTQSDAVPKYSDGSQRIAPAAMAATRPMYWSVLRELWENRSIYVAPLIVAAVTLFGFAISTIGMPHRRAAVLLLNPEQQRAAIAQPYNFAALLIMFITFIVGVFYCLDALHGERRDRSILFWKSLPVSDLTTVLSKASIPLVVLPLITFAITVATQLMMMLWSSAILLPSGLSATTWTHFHWVQQALMLLYHLVAVHALWYAPIFCWLLLVSGWARRSAFLWATLPLLAIGIIEKFVFNSSHFASMLRNRFLGGPEGVAPMPKGMSMDSMTPATPGQFLASPGLWIGLAFAAACLAAAVRLRRYREPI
jgi:ABC-2 type transport system permease protein